MNMVRMTYKTLVVGLLLTACHIASLAQGVTYNHDASVMNQFLVGETGAGHLTPDLWYDAFHKNYRNTAMFTNKQMFRLQMQQMALTKEEKHSEVIDSTLNDRKAVEAKNVLDRTAGTDLSWLVERNKIESKMALLKSNISKITLNGGTSAQYHQWLERYNALQCGLDAIRNSYLPQGSRKAQYIAIYKDIVAKNIEVCELLEYLLAMRDMKKIYNKGKAVPVSDFARIAEIARGRWRYAMSVGSGVSVSQDTESADDRLDRLKNDNE